MDDRQKSITIRCYDHCHYDLVYPAFFMDVPKATLRKIFKWLFMFDWYRENEGTIAFFDQELPYLERDIETRGRDRIAEKEKTLRDRTTEYERAKLDKLEPKADREKRERRKARIAQCMDRVRAAKADLSHERKKALKDRERAKLVFELYQTAKTESR